MDYEQRNFKNHCDSVICWFWGMVGLAVAAVVCGLWELIKGWLL